ncbi:RED-lik [Metarhizium album ARSEF 1941]|uniref:RED-lik n=1 Tax=Metarhizium album (strain ARSEF 1941) TaxID=1081103 RepID=A0A0B2X2B1_METAS|nr:RED-lik [Metarhizium album ARSEF 1941]KHN99867.1 RED-lik [Metarhizium album ARSEF 1941]
MNNEQFRKLMLANSQQASGSKSGPPLPAAKPSSGGTALGSRQRASMPMTPRSVAGHRGDFARQLADCSQSDRPQKRVRISAPRGVRLADGYVDRAQPRDTAEVDDRQARLEALEESYKNEEIDGKTYERLRFQIAGGDLESTHLVKGLDFKLLERIRRGEDVYSKKPADPTIPMAEDDDAHVDDALDELESQEVHAIEREKAAKKKGQLSTVVARQRRTRDQILADMKAARAAAKEHAEPSLGDRFRKIGTTQKLGTRIERDSKGREVLIIVDADGHEKRKVRKLKPGEENESRDELPMPDKSAKPLGMEVPEQYRKKEEPVAEDDGEVNIFDDVGDDYDPLAGMDDSESCSGSDAETTEKQTADNGASQEKPGASDAMPPTPKPQTGARNYFQGSKTRLVSEEAGRRAPSMSDPAIMAAIKKAAALRPIESEDDDDESRQNTTAAEERRRRLLQMSQRDDDDLDMGFGTSRYEDEDDFEDHKLASWGDDGGDGEGGRGRNARGQRKRGPKKRKGDANNAEAFLRMMESRKAA